MPNVSTLIERAKALGLPIAKNAFAGTLDEPVPEMPYLVYLTPHTTNRGPDYRNGLKAQDFDLELYTQNDDAEREYLAAEIESKVFYDVEFDVYIAQIDDEDCFQTAYEIRNLLTKA